MSINKYKNIVYKNFKLIRLFKMYERMNISSSITLKSADLLWRLSITPGSVTFGLVSCLFGTRSGAKF